MKTEIQEKLGDKQPASLDSATASLTKYYMYMLNEASLGLYFSQYISKKVVKEMFDSEVILEKERVHEDLSKYNALVRTMEKETKELATLKDDWATSMTEKLSLLTK